MAVKEENIEKNSLEQKNKNVESKELKINANGQYIKNLSFENLQAPQIYTERDLNPQIKVSIDINATKLQEEIFEIEMIINATAFHKDKEMFIVELIYAGIFGIKNVDSEENLKELLFIYCPSLLFPYARRIISDTTRDAALPPLMLDTINFRALYQAKKDKITKNFKK